MAAKSTRRSFTRHNERATQPGLVYFMDVQGPYQTPSLEGKRYVVCFIGSYSRRCFIHYAERKSEVFHIFSELFYPNVMKPTFVSHGYQGVMTVVSDNGEFKSNAMREFCLSVGVKQNFTCPYTPEHNAPIERLFRTLDMMTNAMMVEKKMKPELWEYVHEASAYLYNRLPRRDTAHEGFKSPEELFTGVKPSLAHVRVIGSKAIVHIPAETRLKDHGARAVSGILIGYSEDQVQSYKVLCQKENENEIFISAHVEFDEGEDPMPCSVEDDEAEEAELQVPKQESAVTDPEVLDQESVETDPEVPEQESVVTDPDEECCRMDGGVVREVTGLSAAEPTGPYQGRREADFNRRHRGRSC